MKINEVPQDDANLLEGKGGEVQYALDENGNYIKAKSVGWEPKNIVIQQAWEEENEKIEEALESVKRGEKSPIYYFMFKSLMNLSILSQYTGYSKWKIKKHFKPNRFIKLTDSQLEKYVYAFGLNNISDLKNPVIDEN